MKKEKRIKERKVKKIKHLNICDVEAYYIGHDDDDPKLPKQVLLTFDEDEMLQPLEGITVFHGYGHGSLCMSYSVFKRIVCKLVIKMAESNKFFEKLISDDPSNDEYENTDELFEDGSGE